MHSHPPAIYLQSSHCYCIVPTRIMPCQKKCSTCHELKVSYKEVPHWLKDLILPFSRTFQILCLFWAPSCYKSKKTVYTVPIWDHCCKQARSYFSWLFLWIYVSFFLLLLNQCACFTKKQAALVAEWVPKIWFSSTYLLEFERWNKPWNGLKATWTRFIFNFLYFSKFCMYVHTSNGTCNFEKSSIMIWNR